MTTTTVDQIQQQASEWTEKIRVRLRELIESTGLTYKSISNETGIPYSTLQRRLNNPGSAIYVHDIYDIWKACGKPGELSDIFA